jgi:hypothetical protein|mmetsp:Transcript_30367/g.5493  ORF Transcript_30367/g.5493 Transcript_30367/m.5493 type:complete len:110 (-) Transcript_30367:664-993(-)
MYDVDVEIDTESKRDTVSSIYMRRIYRGVRFIRLVRIVKLYKYFSKEKQDGAIIEEEEEDQETKMDPRSLGKKLSDVTTRRVIIGVLLMLLLLPLMLFDTFDNSQYYGL